MAPAGRRGGAHRCSAEPISLGGSQEHRCEEASIFEGWAELMATPNCGGSQPEAGAAKVLRDVMLSEQAASMLFSAVRNSLLPTSTSTIRPAGESSANMRKVRRQGVVYLRFESLDLRYLRSAAMRLHQMLADVSSFPRRRVPRRKPTRDWA